MTTETKSVAQLAAETKAVFDRKFDELKGIATDALGRAEKGEGLSEGAKQKADEAITAVSEAKARLDEMEQKMANFRQSDGLSRKSVGQMVLANDGVKAMMAAGKGRASVEIDSKAIISGLTTDADGSAGDLVVEQRVGLVPGVERRLTIRDLLMPGRTSSSSIQYPKETGFTNSADTHTETAGSAKPQSEIKFDLVTSTVTTIAHWVLATRQILDDAPMLQSYIDGRLRYGLKLVEEDQLLNGGGTGTDLNGIYTQATALSANPMVVASPTKIDVIRVAMLQAALAEFPPNGVVLHPTDWAGIELTKDTAGAYIIGNPQDSAQPRLWGLPVVGTQAMTIDKFLVGSFGMGAQIFDRADATVEISTEDSDNFRKNLVTILAEERLALAVYRPEAFVKGDFSDAITDLTS
ncbi:MAG: phage major capsid protein [Sphingomonadales bacterium]|nr:MAG: phage major capsid protein [Sphingomonadales bacterium]